MAKYTPKLDDIVLVDGKGMNRYVIVSLDSRNQTADVRNMSLPVLGIFRDIPWANLHHLDESQNALPIGREVT